MKKGIWTIWLMLAVSLVILAPVWAEMVTVEVEGVVNSIGTDGGFTLDGSVSVGSAMTGYTIYDTDTPDLDPGDVGAYPVISISMTVGNYTFTHDSGEFTLPWFWVSQTYSVHSGLPRFDGTIYINGSSQTYDDITWGYTSLELFDLWTSSEEYAPTGALPDLDSWPDISVFNMRREFEARFYEPYAVDRGYFEIYGEITSLTVTPEPATTYYVDALNGDDDNDGSSWEDAFKHLQDALAAASSSDEIRVAQGIYRPDEDSGHPGGTGDREATFQLISGVAVYGGYAGYGEPDPNARDIEAYETILSGDLNGDDVDVDDPRDLLSEPTRAENSYHVVTGSGTDETTVLHGFTVTAGHAYASDDYYDRSNNGGGVYNDNGSPTVMNCTFSGNLATSNGAGMYNNDYSSPTVTRCIFSRNSVGYSGGGMANERSSSPRLTDCIFNENRAGAGGGMYNYYKSNPRLTHCTFNTNWAIFGGGIHNNDVGSPTLTNCTFNKNSAKHYGGGMYNGNGSPTITNCTFSGNSANRNSGGGIWNHQSSPTLTNCTFSGNSAYSHGGGVYNWGSSRPTLTNCTFAANSATNGRSLACDFFLQNYPSTVEIDNCILWDGGNEIWNNDGSTITITFSDVQGSWPGTGNINADPLFLDPDDGDLRLLPGSPCIDAGNNTAVPADTTDLDGNPRIVDGDSDGNSVVDMGAYEFIPNTAPVADAGQDQTVYAEIDGIAEVTLDGSDSNDPDGDELTYLWSWTVDSNSYEANGVSPTIELPVGDHTIESVVNDGRLDSEPDYVNVNVVGLHDRVVELINEAIAEKEEAFERIDSALEKELEAFETLEQLLETGDYGDWSREDILAARWKISIAILYDEDYIKKVLEKNIDKLQLTLSVLGIKPGQGSNTNMAESNAGAYEPAVLSLNELVINLIDEALAEKAEALEIISAALEKERKAYEILEQLLESGDYGDWNRQAIVRAKSRIYVAIKYEEYLKKVLMIITVEKLEDSLSVLGTEPDVGSG